jgi:hypothetical protein
MSTSREEVWVWKRELGRQRDAVERVEMRRVKARRCLIDIAQAN